MMKSTISHYYSPDRIIFLLLLFFIVLTRIIYVYYWRYYFDADESVVGIMAKHILENNELPIYFYGQNYLGTLEQFTAALFFRLLGVGPVVLKLVPFLYYLLCVILLFLIARIQQRNNLYAFLIFIAIPSNFLLIWTLKARGGFVEAVFLCLIFSWILLKAEQWHSANKGSVLTYGLWMPAIRGLISGFALYVNTVSLPFLAGTLLVICTNRVRIWRPEVRRLLQAILAFIVGFIIGISPIIYHWIYIFKGYGVTFKAHIGSILQKADILFLHVLPFVFGGVTSRNGLNIFSFAEWGLLLLNCLAIISAFIKYRKYFLWMLLFKKVIYPFTFTWLVILLAYLVACLLSVYMIDFQSGRYLIFAFAFLPFFLLELYNSLITYKKHYGVMFMIFYLIFGSISCAQLFIVKDDFKLANSTFKQLYSDKKYEDLIAFLEEEKINTGFADYWTQWDINFLSNERLQFAAYNHNRYLPYLANAMNEKKPVYIFRVLDDCKDFIPQSERIFYQILNDNKYSIKMIDSYMVFY